MEIKITTKQVLGLLLIISWIIFVGICIEACGFLTNAVFALAKPSLVPRLWQQVDLSELFKYDRGWYFVITLIVSIVAVMKVWLFFLILKILHNRKLDMTRPFSGELIRFVFSLSAVALLIGLFSAGSIKYIERIAAEGVHMPDTQHLNLGGGDVWLFMAVILFVIAQILKRGIQMQTENELTI